MSLTAPPCLNLGRASRRAAACAQPPLHQNSMRLSTRPPRWPPAHERLAALPFRPAGAAVGVLMNPPGKAEACDKAVIEAGQRADAIPGQGEDQHSVHVKRSGRLVQDVHTE